MVWLSAWPTLKKSMCFPSLSRYVPTLAGSHYLVHILLYWQLLLIDCCSLALLLPYFIFFSVVCYCCFGIVGFTEQSKREALIPIFNWKSQQFILMQFNSINIACREEKGSVFNAKESKKIEVETHSKRLKNTSNPILLEHKWKERNPHLSL